MFEISVILDNELVYEREFKSCKQYIRDLRKRTPDDKKMREMEGRFLNLVKNDRMIANYYKIAAGIGISLLTTGNIAYADTLGGVSDKLKTIVSPVIELLAGLGYPVTYGMLITGFIMVIMGKKHKGLEIIKWACIGYVGLQFVPFILNILELIGRELRNSL